MTSHIKNSGFMASPERLDMVQKGVWVKVSGQASNSRYNRARCPKFTVQQLGRVLCLHSSSYSACHICDSQIMITYVLAPNCNT